MITQEIILNHFKDELIQAQKVVKKQSFADVSFRAEIELDILHKKTLEYEAVKLAFDLLNGKVKLRSKTNKQLTIKKQKS